jgi:hypothetical protein
MKKNKPFEDYLFEKKEIRLQKLLMVRHGETELNSALRYWGRSDVKLSSSGL